jgi:uncharacterized metal-binding protein YceD (DUF177 family)
MTTSYVFSPGDYFSSYNVKNFTMPRSFKYRIRGLAAGHYPVDLAGDTTPLDMPPFFGDAHAKGALVAGRYLHFHLDLSAEGHFICDRCGREFDRSIGAELDLYFVPHGEHHRPTADDLYIHEYDPQQVTDLDLSEDIRDALLLAIPMKMLHSPDCTGIPLSAFEPEEDEKTEVLKGLYEKLRKEEGS